MPNENKPYLWKAIDRWENEGGAPGATEQTSMLSSNQGANALPEKLPVLEGRSASEQENQSLPRRERRDNLGHIAMVDASVSSI